MMGMGRPNVIVLKEGTDTSQGKAQLISNINACQAVVNIVRTTLGPRGMDKLISSQQDTTISNDGATLMKKLEVEHPAAKTLVDISMSQDSEVGDGTTSVVVLAGEFLSQAKKFLEDGVHPQIIIRSYRQALALALQQLHTLCVEPDKSDLRATLEKCAVTALNSKLVAYHGDFFAKMSVDAVLTLDGDLDPSLIGIKKVPGGTMLDSFLVEGVAFKKTFSYAGFEQQPKSLDNPVILLLNIELELKAEKDNAEIRVKDPKQYQSIVDAEWDIIYNRLDKCAQCAPEGRNLIVLSKLAIGDLATQYFADRNIFCAGRITSDDMKRIAAAVGGMVQTTVSNVAPSSLGSSERFEEKQVGAERYNIFTGCPAAKTATIVLRGGAEQFIEETDRSIHDAIMIVRRALKNTKVVGGGGAIEMLLSKFLRDKARQQKGKQHLLINGYAQALEVIPRQLAENAGFESADIMNNLRYKHNTGGDDSGPLWFGVDVDNDGICDTLAKPVWEPLIVKKNALTAATEAACLILSVDETIKNENRAPVDDNTPIGGRAPIGGRGMAGMLRGRGRSYRGMRGK